MPEIIEVELYRRAARGVIGRTIVDVDTPDAWYLKRGLSADALRAAIVGGAVVATPRRGKLLMLDIACRAPASQTSSQTPSSNLLSSVTIGLRFGMTGRLIVDERAPIAELEYGSARDEPAWRRLTLHFDGGGSLVISDPRRLGAVELEPDVGELGPDAYTLTPAQLAVALAGSDAPLKARLMDQARIAGLGNLLTDEVLWRAGLDPMRPARSLDGRARSRLARTIDTTLRDLTERGGSHTGDLHVARARGSRCPRDGAALERRMVGGRTTYSCPRHQR